MLARPRAEERPVSAAGGDVGEDLEEEERHQHEGDQAEDDEGVGHAVVLALQLPWAQDQRGG